MQAEVLAPLTLINTIPVIWVHHLPATKKASGEPTVKSPMAPTVSEAQR